MNGTQVIEVIAEMKWGQLEVLSNMIIPIITIIATSVLAYYIYLQTKYQRQALEKYENDYAHRLEIDSFKIMDQYNDKNLLPYRELIEKYSKIFQGNKIVKLSKKELDETESLLNEFETFAVKWKKLKLDMNLIYEIMGNTILVVMSNSKVKDLIRNNQETDSDLYTNIKELYYNIVKFITDKNK